MERMKRKSWLCESSSHFHCLALLLFVPSHASPHLFSIDDNTSRICRSADLACLIPFCSKNSKMRYIKNDKNKSIRYLNGYGELMKVLTSSSRFTNASTALSSCCCLNSPCSSALPSLLAPRDLHSLSPAS